MTLSATALTTLAAAKTYLRLTGVAEDAFVESLIESSTGRIEDRTRRRLVKRTLIEDYDGTGTPHLLLREHPIVGILSVNIDPLRRFESGTEVVLDDLVVSANEGKISLAPGAGVGSVFGWTFILGVKVVRVQYVAGYDPIPPQLGLACQKLVAQEYRRSRQGADGFASESTGGYSATYKDGMSQDILELINPYTRLG